MSYFRREYRVSRRFPLGYFLTGLVGVVVGAVLIWLLVGGVAASPGSGGNGQPGGASRPAPAPMVNLPVGQAPVVSIAEKVGPAVVGITNVKDRDIFRRPAVEVGSGIIIDAARGYIVTNYHVIAGNKQLIVTLGQDKEYPARVVGIDAHSDLAVLQIEGDNLPAAVLGDSMALRVGELVVAIGNPLGPAFARSVTAGVVSALDREITVESRPGVKTTLRVMQTDAAINPGNSGGALVNSRGEVVGINSVKIAAAEVEGMGFAIPIHVARPIIEEIVGQGYVSRPFLGVILQEVTGQVAVWLELAAGVYVAEVVPNSPAAQAGLAAGDRIIEVDGRQVRQQHELQAVLEGHRPGDRLNLTIERGDGEQRVTITLAEMPVGAGIDN